MNSNLTALAAQFEAECAEAGLPVTWAQVSPATLDRVLALTVDPEEVLCELVQMFNHPANF